MYKTGHVAVKYVKMPKEEKDKFPQCKCGQFVRKFYEILPYVNQGSESPGKKIICAMCFEKLIIKFLE